MKKIISMMLAIFILLSMFSVSVYADDFDSGFGGNSSTIDDELDNGYCLTSKILKFSGEYVKGIPSGVVCCLANRLFNDPGCVNFYSGNKKLSFDSKLKTGDLAVYIDGNLKSNTKKVALCGDFDCNSLTNVTDIVTEISYVLGSIQSEPSELAIACADINNDGVVTVTDIVNTRAQVLSTDDSLKTVKYDSKVYSVSEYYDYFKTQGRCYNLQDKLAVDFTGCGVEFNAICSGNVSVKLSADNGKQFRAVVDGVEGELLTVGTADSTGLYTLNIASNLAAGVHSFAIYKSSEISNASISSISLCGVLCQKPYTGNGLIEIIGDSITCGTGNTISVTNNDGTKYIDHTGECTRVMLAFTNKATNEVSRYDIDYYRTVSAGYLIDINATEQYTFSPSEYTATQEFYDKDGNLITSVPYKNNQVSYLQDGTKAYSYLTAKNLGYDWNIFAKSGATLVEMYNRYSYLYNRDTEMQYKPDRQSDVVVINLSTNSVGNLTEYKEYMGKFVTLLKTYHKNCKIVFAYGAMTQYTFASLYNTITSTVTELGGSSAGVYQFKFTQSRDGSDGHPSIANDIVMADELAGFIKTIQ